jgi:hypothetical protein
VAGMGPLRELFVMSSLLLFGILFVDVLARDGVERGLVRSQGRPCCDRGPRVRSR